MIRRLWDHFMRRNTEKSVASRLTRAEAIEIARRHILPDGELFMPGAEAEEVGGRVVWRVVTHTGYRGAHSQIDVDDETGKVIRVHHVNG